jgi:arginine exporter protein ArgO
MKWICGLFNLCCAIALFVIGAQNNGGETYSSGVQYVGGIFLLVLGFVLLYSALQDFRHRAQVAHQRAEREAVASEEAEIKKFLDSSG